MKLIFLGTALLCLSCASTSVMYMDCNAVDQFRKSNTVVSVETTGEPEICRVTYLEKKN